MEPGQRYILNTQRIAYQTFENEIVIIDFETGSYFCIDKSGTFIWSQIESRSTLDEITAAVRNRFSTDGKNVEAIVAKFVRDLVDEALILPVDESARSECRVESGKKSECQHDPSDFQEPQLHKFTDMQELLLLDPIHDVQDNGWPGKRTD